jgi:hypothetical protein
MGTIQRDEPVQKMQKMHKACFFWATRSLGIVWIVGRYGFAKKLLK